MNKLGFMLDLIRGIKKITDADKEKPVVNQTTVINNNSAVSGSVAPLLKRAFMFLEDQCHQLKVRQRASQSFSASLFQKGLPPEAYRKLKLMTLP